MFLANKHVYAICNSNAHNLNYVLCALLHNNCIQRFRTSWRHVIEVISIHILYCVLLCSICVIQKHFSFIIFRFFFLLQWCKCIRSNVQRFTDSFLVLWLFNHESIVYILVYCFTPVVMRRLFRYWPIKLEKFKARGEFRADQYCCWCCTFVYSYAFDSVSNLFLSNYPVFSCVLNVCACTFFHRFHNNFTWSVMNSVFNVRATWSCMILIHHFVSFISSECWFAVFASVIAKKRASSMSSYCMDATTSHFAHFHSCDHYDVEK